MYFMNFTGSSKAAAVILLLPLAWLCNHVIDGLGHSMHGDIPVRRPRTHSIFTAPIWGLLSALPFYWASEYFSLFQPHTETLGPLISFPSLVWLFVAGVYVAYNHLFLDSLTEAGIYFTTRRIALAHLRYNERIINTLFVVFGLLMIYMSLVAPSVSSFINSLL